MLLAKGSPKYIVLNIDTALECVEMLYHIYNNILQILI